MLHMVVQTHAAESCPLRSEENKVAYMEAFNRMVSLGAEHGGS